MKKTTERKRRAIVIWFGRLKTVPMARSAWGSGAPPAGGGLGEEVIAARAGDPRVEEGADRDARPRRRDHLELPEPGERLRRPAARAAAVRVHAPVAAPARAARA